VSHEGIRMISAAESKRLNAEPAPLPPEATEPTRVRVMKSEGTGLWIDWRDGHQSHWTFAWLRAACPCATCHEERERDGREPGEPKPKSAALLPLYQAPPRPEAAQQVGRYAISFEWNDGHTSGIYSWDFLRRHCLCAECAAGRAADQ
jgi:DUF971 family protein